MPFRFITKSIHTYLNPVAIVLMVAPILLKLGKSSPVALWLSVVSRVTALLLPALTDHPAGLVRVIRYWLHLWVDRALGVVSITAPSAFHFTGLDAWYYWVLAAAVLLTTSVLNAPEVSVASVRRAAPAPQKPTSGAVVPRLAFDERTRSTSGTWRNHGGMRRLSGGAYRETMLRRPGGATVAGAGASPSAPRKVL